MIEKPDALILAAGSSRRMRRFKPLLNLNDKPFIIHILDKLDTLVNTICIVTGYQAEMLVQTINRLQKNYTSDIIFIHNPNYQKGMFTSLKSGVSTLQGKNWILYHFVDQPHIPGDFYFPFIRQINENYDWIQPRYHEQNGHPILFSSKISSEICRHADSSDLKSISRFNGIRKFFWDCLHPEVLEDFDTREDLSRYYL